MIKKYSMLFCIIVSVHAFGVDKKPSGYNPFQNLGHNIKLYESVLKRRFDFNRPVSFSRCITATAIDALPFIGASLVYKKLTDKAIDTLPLNTETKQAITSSVNNALKANLGYACTDVIRPPGYLTYPQGGNETERKKGDYYIEGKRYLLVEYDGNGVPLVSPVWKNLFGVSTHIATDLCMHAAKQTEVGKKIHDTIDKHVDIAPGSIAAIVQFIAIGLVRYKLFG
ncbi:MAG TPA: hypothetical protein VGW78_01335 [Candidatus Babeliales bacterium]|jgi:hypothetical protein|nr:hypothetical protein [Candidatus Babeliales bacterium]